MDHTGNWMLVAAVRAECCCEMLSQAAFKRCSVWRCGCLRGNRHFLCEHRSSTSQETRDMVHKRFHRHAGKKLLVLTPLAIFVFQQWRNLQISTPQLALRDKRRSTLAYLVFHLEWITPDHEIWIPTTTDDFLSLLWSLYLPQPQTPVLYASTRVRRLGIGGHVIDRGREFRHWVQS